MQRGALNVIKAEGEDGWFSPQGLHHGGKVFLFFFPEPFNLLGCCSPWQNYCHLSCMFVFAINKCG